MMKRVLIYYMDFHSSIGGGEFLSLLFIAELQKTCDVTLSLNWNSSVEKAAELAGVPIDISKLKIVLVKPRNEFLRKLDAILPFYRIWMLKKLAVDTDVCISTANMIDFGKPAHHFVYLLRLFGDNAFMDYVSHVPPKKGFALLKQKTRTFLAETILRPLLGIRSTRKILSDPREHIYPTSHYVDKVMREFYGPFNGTVFYPPTSFEVKHAPCERDPLQVKHAPCERDPLRVVYLGRLFPEKRIDAIIDIVEQARNISGKDLTLRIAGHLEKTAFVEKLKQTASEKTWVQLVGPLYGEDKERFLLTGTYAIHAERDEAFGISITEYLKAGCIPIVPDEGGTVEIVDSPALTYHTDEDAAQILARLLADEAFRGKQRARCAERARLFSMQAYMEKQHRILNSILAETEKN
jgi:glycosyltransferase involved in cell wall biosynthesis